VVFEHSLTLADALRMVGVFTLVAVGFVAFGRQRRAFVWLAVACMGLVLSLGPYLMLSAEVTLQMRGSPDAVSPLQLPMLWVMKYVPYFMRFGHPERFIVMAQAGGLMALAAAAPAVFERLKGRNTGAIVAVGLVAIACVDAFVLNRAEVYRSEPLKHSRFLHGLADDEGTVIVSLPLNASDFICDHQRIHRRPMLNGYGSFFLLEVVRRQEYLELRQNNSVYRYLNQLMPAGAAQPLPDIRDWDFFMDSNVRCAIVHKSVFEPGRRYERGEVVEYWNLTPHEYDVVESGMSQLLGAAIYEDDDITAFDMTRAWPGAPKGWRSDQSGQVIESGTR